MVGCLERNTGQRSSQTFSRLKSYKIYTQKSTLFTSTCDPGDTSKEVKEDPQDLKRGLVNPLLVCSG